MSRVCQVTGKRPAVGNNRSHALNATRRRFLPNLHTHRFWVESENRFVTLRLTAKGMRIIDKKGIDAQIYTQALKEYFGGKCNPRKIIKYARQFNLEPKVRTYMEVLG